MLITEAKKWVGTVERGGANKGKEVEEFQKAVDGKAQGESWCLAFIQYCVKKVDADFNRLYGGPTSGSWIANSEHCLTAWINTNPAARIKTPEAGAVVIWQFFVNGNATSSGHAGLVTGIKDKTFMNTVEGNTSPNIAGSQREGDGVYEKVRPYTYGNTLKIKGFLFPWNPKEEYPFGDSFL